MTVRSRLRVLEQQQLYEGFIRETGAANVGELALSEGEESRAVKVRLRRAANRMGTAIEIWDADGKVYFRSAASAPKRGRPRKA
jgi:hypothetical protein